MCVWEFCLERLTRLLFLYIVIFVLLLPSSLEVDQPTGKSLGAMFASLDDISAFMRESIVTEGVCVGPWEHFWSVVMWEFTTACGVFCERVCVCSILSEVAEHPDTLFTCFYDNRTNQKYPRNQKAISVINSVITVYHKRDDYFYHLLEATTETSQKGCNWAIMHFCMHNFLRLRDFRADIEVHCLTETNGDAKFRLIWY